MVLERGVNGGPVSELQEFVPVLAFVVQGGMAILGASLLLSGRGSMPIRWLAGLSYPVGATVVGTIQWGTFAIGRGDLARFLIAFAAVVLLLIAGIRRLSRTNLAAEAAEALCPWAVSLFALIALVGFAALIVAESSSLGEEDPRWQWAYRAKIMATYAGPDTPLITDPEVLHCNRKYPMLFSAAEAVTLRLMGGTDRVACLRAIPYSFFLSYVLLVGAYALAHRDAAAGILTLLVALTMPQIWILGLDAAYVDFPLGVAALGLLLGLTELRRGWSGIIVPLILGAAVGSLKSEGMVLVTITVICTLACRPYRSRPTEALRTMLPLLGAAVMLLPHAACLSYADSRSTFDNVQYSDIGRISFSQFVNSYSTIIYHYLADGFLNVTAIGLFVPLVLLSAILVRSYQARLPVCIALTYLIVMSVPFLFTRASLRWHLQVVVLRFFFQLIPLLTLTIFEGISRTISDRTAWRGFRSIRSGAWRR
jgi:hypothetical protein